MFYPDSAKEVYGFRDADEREDHITLALIKAVQCSRREIVTGVVTLVLVMVITAGITFYQLQSGFSMTPAMISICLVAVYVPKSYQIWKKYKYSSKISYDVKKSGSHFLLCLGECTRKNEEHDGIWSLRVKAANGTTLEDVLVSKAVYDSIKIKDALSVVILGSGEGSKLAGLPYSYYKVKNNEHVTDVVDFETEKMSQLKSEDVPFILEKYKQRKELRSKLFQKNLVMVIVFFAACVIAGVLKNMAVLIYPPLFAIVLVAGIFYMNFDEDRQFAKHLEKPEEVSCVEAYVSEIDSKSGDMKFTSLASGNLLYTSKKKEDTILFHKNDRCQLLYYKKEKPVPLTK